MTTKTNITLPPLPEWSKMDDLGGLVPSEVRVALAGYARAAVEADRQDRMPSDDELLKWAGEEQFFLFCDEDEFLQIAREVLSRYGSGQPAASVEPNAEARRALEIASDLRKDFRDDTHNYDTMLGAATLLESFAATAAPVAQGAVSDPLSWLETEIDAVNCRHYGDPAYDHDAYWFKRQALKLVAQARKIFATPIATQPWQELAAAMYQAAGAYDMPVRILDALSAAANGEPFAHLIDGLLPVECPEVSAQDREDAERIRNSAEILDTLTSNLDVGHPLREIAANGAKQAVADLYRIADQISAAHSKIEDAK